MGASACSGGFGVFARARLSERRTCRAFELPELSSSQNVIPAMLSNSPSSYNAVLAMLSTFPSSQNVVPVVLSSFPRLQNVQSARCSLNILFTEHSESLFETTLLLFEGWVEQLLYNMHRACHARVHSSIWQSINEKVHALTWIRMMTPEAPSRPHEDSNRVKRKQHCHY